jgi:hypothetical protein
MRAQVGQGLLKLGTLIRPVGEQLHQQRKPLPEGSKEIS